MPESDEQKGCSTTTRNKTSVQVKNKPLGLDKIHIICAFESRIENQSQLSTHPSAFTSSCQHLHDGSRYLCSLGQGTRCCLPAQAAERQMHVRHVLTLWVCLLLRAITFCLAFIKGTPTGKPPFWGVPKKHTHISSHLLVQTNAQSEAAGCSLLGRRA